MWPSTRGIRGGGTFTREELQAFSDYADAQMSRVVAAGRKSALAVFRDAVLLKVIHAWGLRRRGAAMLDVADWHPTAAAPQLGRFGCVHVRYGKAMRGSPPRAAHDAERVPVGDGGGGAVPERGTAGV